MIATEILNSNFDLSYTSYPKNIYAVRIKDDKDVIYDISVEHNGFCPKIYSERDQSTYNDYLSNLEYTVVNEFFKSIKKRRPKVYLNLIEVVTNDKGELYHLSRVRDI
jgi:hypothetical protein